MSPWLRVPFYYGWIVVATAFASSLVAAGIRSASQVFIIPLEGEFGWTRTAIALSGALLASRIRAPRPLPSPIRATA